MASSPSTSRSTMAAELTPLKAVKCSYDDCSHSFNTEDEMRAHLKNRDIHPYYCGKNPGFERLQRGFVKCDFHGKTFEDLLSHKVETMLPWLVGERRFEKPKKFMHVVCEFCGEDFGSLGGREVHRKRFHQAEQHVVCKGYLIVRDGDGNISYETCGSIFGRASQLIAHIEGGFCAYIKPLTLRQEREHKHIVKLILEDPESFKKNMTGMPYTPVKPPVKDIDDTSGGVSIDLHSESNFDLNSELPSPSTRATPAGGKSSEVEWPSLPGSHDSQLSDSMKNFSISAENDNTSPMKFVEYNKDEIISLCSHDTTTNSDNDDGPASPAAPGDPWSGKSVAEKLFGRIRAKVIPNWDAIAAAHQRNKEEDEGLNIFTTHFWDPYHADFKPEFFYRPDNTNEVIPYQCPFKDCERRFMTPQQIGDHMRESHATQKNRCPACLKNFRSLSALVSHFESSSSGAKCKVARLSGYTEMLFEMTGGLIKAEKALEEPIYGHKLEPAGNDSHPARKAEIKPEQWITSGNGVKEYSYRAVSPTRIRVWSR